MTQKDKLIVDMLHALLRWQRNRWVRIVLPAKTERFCKRAKKLGIKIKT